MTLRINVEEELLRAHLAKIGRKGGSSKSPKKQAASRKNADKAWRARWRPHAPKAEDE